MVTLARFPCAFATLLKIGRYYNTTMCHYWDMSVKQPVYYSVNQAIVPNLTHRCATCTVTTHFYSAEFSIGNHMDSSAICEYIFAQAIGRVIARAIASAIQRCHFCLKTPYGYQTHRMHRTRRRCTGAVHGSVSKQRIFLRLQTQQIFAPLSPFGLMPRHVHVAMVV